MKTPCLKCGFCCTQGTCPFGVWDTKKHRCRFLTRDMLCAKYDEIKDLPGAEVSPAFGQGCSSPGNSMRRAARYMSFNYPFTAEQFKDHDGKIKWGLEIPDLPGVWAFGDTLEEAHARLLEHKRLWLETCIEKGVAIPEPVVEGDFDGKFILRLPPRLHRSLQKGADQEGISLHEHILARLIKEG